MLSTLQRRLLIASGMLMAGFTIKPEALPSFDLHMAQVNIIGPVTLPMIVVLILSMVNLSKLALATDNAKQGLVERINFHTNTAVMLGTIGTFAGVAMSAQLNEIALSDAMLSTLAGMGMRLVFRQLVDVVTKGQYSLDGGNNV